jgi:hypothetical protein
MFSARISSFQGENLTPACRMGDDGVFNVVFSLEVLAWSSVYLNSLPKQSLFIWFLRGRIWRATEDSDIKFLSRQEMCWSSAGLKKIKGQSF